MRVKPGDEAWPPLALYPGARVPAAQVDTHAVRGEGSTLQIQVTRYIPEEPWYDEPDTLDTHLMVLAPPLRERMRKAIMPVRYGVEEKAFYVLDGPAYERTLNLATVVVTAAQDRPALLVLDHAMRQYPSAMAVGVVGDRDVLVGLRTTSIWSLPGADPMDANRGYAVTMTPAVDGPAPRTLYASALWGWATWWLHNADILSGRERSLNELPPPPLALDIVEARRCHRTYLSQPERTSWPRPPQLPRDSWEDHGLE